MANLPSRNRDSFQRTGRNQPMDADTMSGLSTRQYVAADSGDDWEVPGSGGGDNLDTVPDAESSEILASSNKKAAQPNPAGQEKLEKLRAENEQMRALVADLRKQVDEAVGQTQEAFAKREEEFEGKLEEKSEELRTLFIRIQETERNRANAAAEHAASPAARRDEERAGVWEDIQREHQTLEEEKHRLQDERRQVRDDEEEMMRRMREMELQVAKSRTDLVRQRNELQQLHNEVRSELEKAQQTGAAAERVRSLRQQHQEVSSRRAGR